MNQIDFHHVMKKSFGGCDEIDNCVALCTNTGRGVGDGCHYRVHQNGFTRGIAAPPEYFIFSHGHEKANHKAWVKRWALVNSK